jgi:hypothetical protein
MSKDKQEGLGEVMYLCPNAPFVNIKLPSGKFQASKGVLKLNIRQAAELDALMVNRPDIKAVLRKVDREAALKAAEDFKARQRATAVQGADHSGTDARRLLANERAAQSEEMLKAKLAAQDPGNHPEDVQKNLVTDQHAPTFTTTTQPAPAAPPEAKTNSLSARLAANKAANTKV